MSTNQERFLTLGLNLLTFCNRNARLKTHVSPTHLKTQSVGTIVRPIGTGKRHYSPRAGGINSTSRQSRVRRGRE
jgi:hypothetical protein